MHLLVAGVWTRMDVQAVHLFIQKILLLCACGVNGASNSFTSLSGTGVHS